MEVLPTTPSPDSLAPASSGRDVLRLRDLSAQQWKSGIAAWLGWLFDGLDMHLYVLVAAPFVSELLHAGSEKDALVGYYSSWIQAAFLIGWALGGGFFGRIADRLGRSRALVLTILTYALFTGLSYFAQTWLGNTGIARRQVQDGCCYRVYVPDNLSGRKSRGDAGSAVRQDWRSWRLFDPRREAPMESVSVS